MQCIICVTCLCVLAYDTPTPFNSGPEYPRGHFSQRKPGAVFTHRTPGKQGLNWHCSTKQNEVVKRYFVLHPLRRCSHSDRNNPYLIYIIAIHPVSCKSIGTGGTLETPRLGTDTHVLFETGPGWAQIRVVGHDKVRRCRNYVFVVWTAINAVWSTRTKAKVKGHFGV